MSSQHGQYPSQLSATPAHYCGMRTSAGVNPSFHNDAFSSQHSSPLMGSGYPLEVHRTSTRRYTTPDGRHVEETVSVVERVPTPDLMPGQWNNMTPPETQNGWPFGTHEYEYGPHAPAPTEPPSEHSSYSERQSLSPDALLLQPYIPGTSSGYLARDSSEPVPTYVAPEFSACPPQSSNSSVAFSGSSSGPPADGSFWDTPAGAELSAMHGGLLAESCLGGACGHDAQGYTPAIAISQEPYAYTESSAQYGSADQNTTNFEEQQQLGWDTAVATASLGGWHPSLSSPSSAAAEPGNQFYPPPPQFSHTYDSHPPRVNQGSMSYASHTPSGAPQSYQHPTQSVEDTHASHSHALTTAEATNWSPGAHDAPSTVGAETETIGADYQGDEYDEYSEDESDSDVGCDASNVGGAPEQYTDDSSRNSISDQHTWNVEKSASSHGPLQFTSETLMAACEHGVPRGVYCSDCRLYYELFGSYMSCP